MLNASLSYLAFFNKIAQDREGSALLCHVLSIPQGPEHAHSLQKNVSIALFGLKNI